MSGKVCHLQERELARVRLRFCSLQIVLFMPAVSASFCLCGWAGVAWWCLPVLPSWFAGLFSSSPLSVWPSRPCQEVSPGTSPLSTRWAKMRLCAPLRYCFDSDLAVVLSQHLLPKTTMLPAWPFYAFNYTWLLACTFFASARPHTVPKPSSTGQHVSALRLRPVPPPPCVNCCSLVCAPSFFHL